MGEKFTMENSEVKSYLEDSIKPKLREKYGDVFENSLNINDETILIDLLELIDDIDFKNLDTDNSFEDKEDECVILSVTKNGIYINETCTVEEMNEKSQKYTCNPRRTKPSRQRSL